MEWVISFLDLCRLIASQPSIHPQRQRKKECSDIVQSAIFGRMSWLDPDRLAALYGQKPLKKAPLPPAEDGGHPLDAPATHSPKLPETVKRAVCCNKFLQGKPCADCPRTT
jgi:hypothetical protein